MKETLRLLAWVPALMWMILIFSLSHMGGGESGALSQKVLELLASYHLDLTKLFGNQAGWVVRKAAHMSEYALLFFLLMIPLHGKTQGLLMAGICAVLFSCSDEVHQAFIPGRVATPVDVAIDSLGVALAAGLFAGLRAFQSWRVAASSQER